MEIMSSKSKLSMTGSWQLLPRNFELLKENIQQVSILLLLPGLALQLGGLLARTNFALGSTVSFIGIVWFLINTPVLTYFTIRVCRGHKLSVADAYKGGLRFFWRVLGFNIAFCFAVTAGILLFIVPGLIILRRYLLGTYYIVDKDVSIMEAARQSAAQTKPVAGYIWGTIGVTLCLAILILFLSFIFVFVPALDAIIAALSGLAYTFIFPLRYVEVTKNASSSKH